MDKVTCCQVFVFIIKIFNQNKISKYVWQEINKFDRHTKPYGNRLVKGDS